MIITYFSVGVIWTVLREVWLHSWEKTAWFDFMSQYGGLDKTVMEAGYKHNNTEIMRIFRLTNVCLMWPVSILGAAAMLIWSVLFKKKAEAPTFQQQIEAQINTWVNQQIAENPGPEAALKIRGRAAGILIGMGINIQVGTLTAIALSRTQHPDEQFYTESDEAIFDACKEGLDREVLDIIFYKYKRLIDQ